MKTIKRIRVILSLAILLVTAVLVWLGRGDILSRYQITLNLTALSLGALITWLIITLLVGRVYCSSVCPVGTLIDIVSWLDKRLNNGGKGRFHFAWSNDRIRYLTLLLVAVSMTASDRYSGVLSRMLDPAALFSTCLGLHGLTAAGFFGLLGILLALVIVAGILWMAWKDGGRHNFCNTVCPVGTALGTVNRVALYRFDIDTDICTGCNLCVEECKACCISPDDHTIDVSRCVMCMNCAASCPDKAIRFTTTRKRLSTPLMQATQ